MARGRSLLGENSVKLNNSVSAVVSACAIPSVAVVPLSTGMRHLFVDAYNGIGENDNAQMYQLREVQDCEVCSAPANCAADCIDDDAWASIVDSAMFGTSKKSIDLLVSIKTKVGLDKLLMVEGKLGCLVNAFTKENYYPTWQSLSAKYHWTMRRINGRVPVCQTMVIVVSQDSIAQMRRRLNAYIRAGQLPPTQLMCPHEFWGMFGVVDAVGSVVCGMSKGS